MNLSKISFIPGGDKGNYTFSRSDDYNLNTALQFLIKEGSKIISNNLKKYLLIALIITFLFSGNILAQGVNRSPRINFNGITGDDFIGQAGLLYPFRNTEDSLWFTDLRYRVSVDDIDEWNLGIGYRKKLGNSDNRIAGAYVFRDRRNEYDYYWDMWTIGGEILTDQCDLRANVYLTKDETKSAPELDNIGISGNQLFYQEGAYSSMDGFDIELGKRFTEAEGVFKDIGIYGKLFRFSGSNTETMEGKQIRINKQFGDRDRITWKIGARYRDDNIRGSDTEATFEVSIPFGKGSAGDPKPEKTRAEIVEARMTEQPERDLDVVVGEVEYEKGEGEKAYDPVTGEKLGDLVYVSADGNEDAEGTKEDPMNIAGLAADSSEYQVIIPMGEIELSKTAELESGQKVVSSNGHIVVSKDAGGSRTVDFSPDVEQAEVIGSGSGLLLVESGGYNTIAGINFKKAETGLKINQGDKKVVYRDNTFKNLDYHVKDYPRDKAIVGSEFGLGDSLNDTGFSTINVAPGTYETAITIDRALTLQAATGSTPVIDFTGYGGQDGITITASDVTIDGFELSGPDTITAIHITKDDVDGVTVSNNIFTNSDYPYASYPISSRNIALKIDGNDVTNITFANNDVTGYVDGVWAEGQNTDNLQVLNNNFNDIPIYEEDSTHYYGLGVQIEHGNNLRVENNTFTGNIDEVDSSLYTDSANAFNHYAVVTWTSYFIGYADYPEIDGGTYIKNNEMTNLYLGTAAFTSAGEISGNDIDNNHLGIQVGQIDDVYATAPSKGLAIENNNITNNYHGIWVQNFVEDGMHASSNNISGNAEYGVKNEDTEIFDAANNWWGTTEESEIENMIEGDVDYTDWLDEPVSDAGSDL